MIFNDTSVMAHLYVAKDLDEPFLGLDLTESFDILRRVNEAGVEPRLDPVSEYPELFQVWVKYCMLAKSS